MSFDIDELAADWRDPEFWEEAWDTGWKQSLLYRQQPERTGGEYWDRRSASFTAQTRDSGVDEQVMKAVHLLGHKDALKRDSRVLDIGSGPGNYAIPIARRVRQVVALDPSGGMLEILKRRAAEAEVANIDIVQQPWETVDLVQAGWGGAFDAVLALMAPPFNGVGNLKKMLAACRGVLLVGGHLRWDDPVRRELWLELGLGEMPDFCPDPFYAYHWLYASGYYPDLEMEHYYSLRQLTPEQAQSELEDAVYPYLDLTAAVREQVRQFVAQRTGEGVFLSASSAVVGWVVCATGAPVPEQEQVHTHTHDHDHSHEHEHGQHHHHHEHDHLHDHDHEHPHNHDHDHEHSH